MVINCEPKNFESYVKISIVELSIVMNSGNNSVELSITSKDSTLAHMLDSFEKTGNRILRLVHEEMSYSVTAGI